MSSSTSSLAQTLHSVHLGLQVGESLAVSSLGQSLELLPFSFLPGSRTLKLGIFLKSCVILTFEDRLFSVWKSWSATLSHDSSPNVKVYVQRTFFHIFCSFFQFLFIFLYFIFFQNWFTYLKYVPPQHIQNFTKKSYWFTDGRSSRNCIELVSEIFAPKALALSF